MGFVTQDDVLYPHLTVSETLFYTALLRLPKSLTEKEKAAKAEAVMAELGLLRCRDSFVGGGGGTVRGISGGERKRVSIGQELLIDPALLLLDEPTSGLDSTTAQKTVSVIADLAAGGRTVAMTIHQPSSRLFYMFHKVMLLCNGSPIYFGRREEVMSYFAGVGFFPSVAMNPADFLLDLANGICDVDAAGEGKKDVETIKKEVVSAYVDHLKWQVKEEISRGGGVVNGVAADDRIAINEETASCQRRHLSITWLEEVKILMSRDIKERRHEAFSTLNVVQVVVLAFISGCLWWKSSGNLQDQTGLLFFLTGFWGAFPLFTAIFTFPMERQMLTKERSSGTYRLSSYYFARMVNDLPMQLVLPTVFILVVYWMAGLRPSSSSFFFFLASILLNVLITQGLGLMLGALIMDLKAAITVASVAMLGFMLAGGFYVQKVPPLMSWMKYFSYNFYTYKLLLVSQFSGDDTYQCSPHAACRVADQPAVKAVGLHHVSSAVFALLAMFVFYRLVAYLALMRIGRPQHQGRRR